ncbi:MAG: hypothetical protein OEX00_11490 [Gammaproteobacteria bacterium]|nr:hypothetical protein [Gammaproteobacteria bacterium]MDH5693663.1 hypothetical protein [Gammaproteobacteria bacterium]
MSVEFLNIKHSSQLQITVTDKLSMDDYPAFSSILRSVSDVRRCRVTLQNLVCLDSMGIGMLALLKDITESKHIEIDAVRCSNQVSNILKTEAVQSLLQ